MTDKPTEPTWPPPKIVLSVALVTTAVVTAVSRFAPDEYANTMVGAVFLGVTWLFVLRRDTPIVRAYGMSLGGLTEPVKLEPRRIAKDTATAIGWCLLLMAITFPPFWYGYTVWWKTSVFELALPQDLVGVMLGQLLVIGLPEEMFFRGYLQSALDGFWSKRRFNVLGAQIGAGWVLSAAIFAIGHLLTISNIARLAVFVPALIFGWLRARTKGVGAGILFHTACNLFSSLLAAGYGHG